MDNQTPVKPQRSPRKSNPQVEASAPEAVDPDKPYMKRSKIGTPTIGRSPDYVQTVGLGNLTVITANGKRNYSESVSDS